MQTLQFIYYTYADYSRDNSFLFPFCQQVTILHEWMLFSTHQSLLLDLNPFTLVFSISWQADAMGSHQSVLPLITLVITDKKTMLCITLAFITSAKKVMRHPMWVFFILFCFSCYETAQKVTSWFWLHFQEMLITGRWSPDYSLVMFVNELFGRCCSQCI